MGTTNSTRLLVATTAVALMGWSARAGAQAEERDQWRFVATPYVWLTALDGTVGLGPVRANADLSATDVFRMLKFGVMGAGEGRKGPWVIGADAIYAKLGTGMTVAVLGDTGSLEFTMRETILQSTGGYTLGDSTLGVDFLVGMRYWNLANTLDVDRTRRPSNERSMTQQWVDGTGGFRFRWVPYEKLRLAAAGDVGGGGSRETWQASSSIGYDAWSKWTFGVAYRILSVNYDRNNFLFDTDTKGFVLGATWRSP